MFFYLKKKSFVLCFFAALMFLSCKIDSDNNILLDNHLLLPSLTGTWESEYNDSYTISSSRLSYNGWSGSEEYAGAIRYVSNFSYNAGVIIIEYDADKKPVYYTSEHWTTSCAVPSPCGHELAPTGNFAGIYYEDLKPGASVRIGQAINLDNYAGAEKTTLIAAINAFTSGNKGKYISMMGVYQK